VLASWGRSDDADAVEFFSLALLEAATGVAVAIKPQVAFFERLGSAGYRVLERVIGDARDADILVVADAKRGDVRLTNEGYALAWLDDRSPLAVDALTVSPYVGFDDLSAYFSLAQSTQRGVFVLAATSNEDGRVIQTALTNEQERIEDFVLRRIAELNRASTAGLGSLGAVIGATRNAPRFDLSQLAGPLLVPGVGAQGATPDDVARLFARCPAGSVLASVSRSLSNAGPDRRSLRDCAQRWRDDLTSALF